ncbi:MAG: phosphatase PAP2-related protein [Candidatus Moranbacteria bacterium]|nr:phosphatase PAP2-related protein [Candidatus Moranbacteria bacterium]
MRKVIAKHKYHWSKKEFIGSIILGGLFLAISLIFNHFTSNYANSTNGAYVKDILLDNLPVFNVNWIMNEGVLFYAIFITFFIIIEPKRIPFILKSLALFVFIRSIFITLTHLGPAPSQTYLDPNDLLADLNFGKDFFFSGHTGIPFLLALAFWKEKIVRYVSILAAIILGSSMILGHLHYSIDVLSAFFITYAIFCIAKKAFANDYKLFNSENLT